MWNVDLWLRKCMLKASAQMTIDRWGLLSLWIKEGLFGFSRPFAMRFIGIIGEDNPINIFSRKEGGYRHPQPFQMF